MSRHVISLLLIFLLDAFSPFAPGAEQGPLPVPAGLQDAVDFWKQVFTRHGAGEVLLFDPIDPATIYRVLRVGETEQGRALVGNERARIAAEYDLVDDESRVRSQRGAKEQFSEGLRTSGRYIAQMQKIFRAEGLSAQLAYLPVPAPALSVCSSSFQRPAGSLCASTTRWTSGAIPWRRPERRFAAAHIAAIRRLEGGPG